jgi:hypothetical protein
MAYADLLEDETVSSQYLMVLRPRRRVTTFTVVTGAIYSAPFDYGTVVKSWDGLTAMDEAASSALSPGEFFYDLTAQVLYVRLSGGGNPNTTWTTVAFELYCATIDAHTYRVPNDDTTAVVYFEPIIAKSPMIKQTTDGAEFGFSPVQTSNVTLINAEHVFERHMYDGSWNQAECLVYHWLGDLETANIKLVLNGLVLSYKLDPPRVELRVVDRIDLLSQEWATVGADAFFSTATFTEVDPNFVGKPIRMVYGRVDGHQPVNVDYLQDAPTTSDNRVWVTNTGQTGLAENTATVIASPTSTTTRTYMGSVVGFNVGDTVWLDKASDEYARVTAVGANYIDHTTISVACSTGNIVRRGFVGSVTIVQDNVEYVAHYGRDYTAGSLAGGASGFTFSSSLETNLSMPETLRPVDRVWARVYGPTNITGLGTNDVRTGNMAHPAQVVFDALTRLLGVVSADIDTASFTAALTDQSSGVGIVVPQSSFDTTYPKYRDVFMQVLKSALGKLIIDADGLWSLLTVKPLGAVDYTIGDDEILRDSLQWDYSHEDLVSVVNVEYNRRELGITETGSELVDVASATSDVATYLHRTTDSKTERSAWIYEAEAQELANRLSFILGERRGTATLRTKNRFYATKLGNNIQIEREHMPGAVLSREHAVTQVEKGRTQVTLTLNDSKGIEDNAGGW